MMSIKKMVVGWGIMAVVFLIINAAILAGAVWLVVKVLQWTGVLQSPT